MLFSQVINDLIHFDSQIGVQFVLALPPENFLHFSAYSYLNPLGIFST